METKADVPSLLISQNPAENLAMEEKIERRFTVQIDELNRALKVKL